MDIENKEKTPTHMEKRKEIQNAKTITMPFISK